MCKSQFNNMANPRSRVFVFTSNNYDDELLASLTHLNPPDSGVRYLVFGKELAPNTGTPHLQGYVVFHEAKTHSSVCKLIPRSFVEVAKGDAEQNFQYCSKGGDFVERGERPVTKKRARELGGQAIKDRWDDARKAAEEGRFEDIDSELYIKYRSSLIKMVKQKPPTCLEGDLCNVWLYGPAGSGKSRKAFEEHPGAYLKGVNKWWDGYDGQSVVIVDDMDPYHKSLALEFKMWGQHQPFAAETKGGTICIRPEKIVVTSNFSIDEVWEDSATRAAMHRRYKEELVGDLPVYPPFVLNFKPR